MRFFNETNYTKSMQYKDLVEQYFLLESTSKRLEKTKIISDLLNKVSDEELNKVILLLQGRVFPAYDAREIGMAGQLVLKAINSATGISSSDIEKTQKSTGDLGKTAEECVSKKKQVTLFSQPLTISKVFDNLQKIAILEGEGTVNRKVSLVSELLTSASPREACYIVRTVLQDLRVGLGDGTLRDAIVWHVYGNELGIKYDKEKNNLELINREKYNETVETVQSAYDIANDFGIVAIAARKKALDKISLVPGRPCKVMLFPKAKTFEEAFETVGKPAQAEYKYDGFRMIIQKHKDDVWIFTRRLEDVKKQFPDVLKLVSNINGDDFIVDGEAVGFKDGKYRPFQEISQRIRRKYDIAETSKDFPIVLVLFDVMFYNGKNLLNTSFIERRKLLEDNVKPIENKLILAEKLVTDSETDMKLFFERSLSAGNEGIMIKNLKGIYKPGARVGYGMKFKPVMETLDVVIVGAEQGEGKRSDWFATFIIAIRDGDNLVEIGRVGTGFKEKDEEGVSFNQISELLKPLITHEDGRTTYFRPEVVIEVNYEEIQKSPTYSSGFALRFPRFVRLRDDRGSQDISTLDFVIDLFSNQRGRNN